MYGECCAMSYFAAWGLTLLGIAVITTVAEMLLPNGKTRKVICSVAATVAVLVIITPIPNLLKNGFSVDFDWADVPTDEAYLSYVDGYKSNVMENAAKQYLASKGYNDELEIEVELDGFEVRSARVNFVESIITDDNSHIHKKEIIKLIAEFFGIGEEAVMYYG